MKILLISVPLMDLVRGEFVPIAMDAKKIAPPYGIYLLSSILKAHNHNVEVADLIAQGNNDLKSYLKELTSYDLIGIGATSFSWPTALRCICEIRRINKNIPIVLGGIHPTMFDSYILCQTDATFIIRGEGELAIVELCQALEGKRDFNNVTNLTYRDSEGNILRNKINKVVDLSTLPIPDYDILPLYKYTGISIESSRGCPYDCIFCSTNYRKTYRAMSPTQFVDRVEKVLPFVEATTHKNVHIIDDEFSLNTKRVIAIAKEITCRKIGLSLVFDSRANDILNIKFVQAIKPHVGRFLIGAECGYDEGLKLIGKKTTTKSLEKAAQILNDHGIANRAEFSFLIGFPWEKYEDALNTLDFAGKLLIKYGVNILLQWYLQIPGSILWQRQRLKGVLSEALYDDYGIFRNPYLFRTGVNFSLKEFQSISEAVMSVRMIREMSGIRKSNKFEYAHPFPIRIYFPESLNKFNSPFGLESLREVSSITNKEICRVL